MTFSISKNISDYRLLLNELYSDFGNPFCHTMLVWCDLMESVYDLDYWQIWIVKQDEHGIGFARRQYHDKAFAICGLYTPLGRKEEVWLGWFGIVPSLRRKGIGTEILKFLESKARKAGAKKILSYVDKGGKPLSFYKKNGFRVIGDVKKYAKKEKISMTLFEDNDDFIIEKKLK